MTPDQIHPGRTYETTAGTRWTVESSSDGWLWLRNPHGQPVREPVASFATYAVRDVTPAPESHQGEKAAQAQNAGLCGDSVAVRAFARDVAEYLYRAGHRDDGPGNSEGVRLLRLAREIAEANQ